MKMGRRETAAFLANEIEDALVRLDDGVRRKSIEVAGRIGGAAVAYVMSLPQDSQDKLAAADVEYLNSVVARLISDISGLPVSEDADVTVEDNLVLTPVSGWAGPVAGPTFLETNYGIPRSTLYRWQKMGEAIGLRVGGRKHVFPLAQFIDGRPVYGLAEISKRFPSHRMAWLWLVESNEELDGERPIDLLRKDLSLEVFQALK